MKIAISGATGFLGKYLVNYLHDSGYNIRILARVEEQAATLFNFKVDIYNTDYSFESLLQGLQSCDIVVHLASQTMQRTSDPLKVSDFYDVNVLITENILRAANACEIKKICNISSNSVYSSANQLPFKESEQAVPSNTYGLSKLFAEKIGEYYAFHTSMNVVSLRLARLFGYGERDSVVFTKYIKQSLLKNTLEVWGEGETSIEYLYVKDATKAIEQAIIKDIKSGVYNVGVNQTYSVKEIANLIATVFDNKENIVFLQEKTEGNYCILMDSSAFFQATNWKAQWSLEEAVKDIKKIYDNHGK
ncbi:MAG: NAD-dependent epimerase/dehydratase family protein [Bacteroidales bacterium]|jgi:UDP-glucose 4-epimerase